MCNCGNGGGDNGTKPVKDGEDQGECSIKPMSHPKNMDEFNAWLDEDKDMLHVMDLWKNGCPPCMRLKPQFEELAQDKEAACNVRFAAIEFVGME